MNIGDKVRTNEYYLNACAWLKKTPLHEGIIVGLEKVDNHNIIKVKTSTGKKRSYNELFLETI
jgi:hypothetical protein